MVCHNIRPLISLIALLALAGCASDALRESDRLMAAGQREAALAMPVALARAAERAGATVIPGICKKIR